MAGQSVSKDGQAAVERAMSLVMEAIDLLDAHGTAQAAAAHLALALDEMRKSNRTT